MRPFTHVCVRKHLSSRWILALALIVSGFSIPSWANFVKIGETSVIPNPGGIAQIGNQFYVGGLLTQTGQLQIYDKNFNPLSTLTLSGAGEIWGLDYDTSTETFFARDASYGRIAEYTTAGTLVQSWADPGGIAGLAVDSRDNSVWLVSQQDVLHYTRTGSLISSFDAGFGLSGIAVDPTHNTLLVLEASIDFVNNDDRIYEFTFSGTPLGQLLPDEIRQNGIDLHYDPTTGNLYATAQDVNNFGAPGTVTIFNDPTRVPEPSSAVFVLGLVMGGFALRRK